MIRSNGFLRGLLVLIPAFGFSCAADLAGIQSSFTSSGVAPVGPTDRIAVLDFEGMGGPAFSDLLAQEFMKAKIHAVERSTLRAAIDEREIGARNSEELDLNTLRSDLGSVTLARVLIVGALVESSTTLAPAPGGVKGESGLLVTCRAIDPKNGRVLWTGAVKTGASVVNGDHAGPLTAWRLAAAEIVKAYKEPSYAGQKQAFAAEAIPGS